MNARQILAQGALAVLHPEEFGIHVRFSMVSYCNGHGSIDDPIDLINACGTSCCFAGHVVLLAGMRDRSCLMVEDDDGYTYANSWDLVFYDLITNGGMDISSINDLFLTSAAWNNDPLQCAERVRIFLTDGQAPKDWVTSDRYEVRDDTEDFLRQILTNG